MKNTIKPLFALAFLLLGAISAFSQTITKPIDYNRYLEIEVNYPYDLGEKEFSFWNKKLKKSPNQYPYLVKMARAQTAMFTASGHVEHLNNAETFLNRANEQTHFNNTALLRRLARNNIAHHKFQNALNLLSRAEGIGQGLRNTQQMLFDVYLEVGDEICAAEYLQKISSDHNFDYLIRKSKWEDHQGNLEGAISNLEAALILVQTVNDKDLMQWSYSNLADYYGHAGRIQDSYNGYLNALSLDPYDAYSLKGIAWIAFSYERNSKEAMRILDQLSQRHQSPDYDLFKGEIAAFVGDEISKNKYLNVYLDEVEGEKYSNMYNNPIAFLMIEEKMQFQAAIALAQKEIKERPTPESYSLLAWALYHNGELQKAMDIIDQFVVGKSEEPKLVFRNAVIYKSSQKYDEVALFKEALLNSIYELGPLHEEIIVSL